MSPYISSGTRPRRSSVIALLIAAGVLYLAKEVLIPVAVAILLSFLLAPAVRRLESWKLGRVASTLIVALFGFGVIFAVAGIAATQAISLGAKLPDTKIVIGLWGSEEKNGSARERLLKLGVDEVVTRISEAPDVLRQLADTGAQASNQETSKRTARR